MFDLANYRIFSPFFRLITSKALNRFSLRGLDIALERFGSLVLPRDALDSVESLVVRDLIGNIDEDKDGSPDSFRLAITNGWYDQRVTGVDFTIDGRRVKPENLLLKSRDFTMRSSELIALEVEPGEPVEIVALGQRLSEGLHILSFTISMELAGQIIPAFPIIMRGEVGDVAILPDRLKRQPWNPEALEPGIVHLVPHIHYDTEWLKTREVFEDVGERNLKEAIRLLDEYEDMTFVIDQVPHLEPFRKRDPEAFARLQDFVREGRVEPVNGMYSEPDTNFVMGESLVRQSVAWQRYSSEKFGQLSSCGWLIDSFGMSAQLPQIFSLSGVQYFAFSRARKESPPTEFLWEGIDGTRIITHNMPRMYSVGYPIPSSEERALLKMQADYAFLREKSATDQVFYPSGVDHGRPQAQCAKMPKVWNKKVSHVKFKDSLPKDFFGSIKDASLPVVKGEFQRELWGTYSSRIEMKQLNRKCEFALLDAGKLSTIASIFGFPYPHETLEDLWRTLMDSQFHDQICGCSVDEVARGMRERFGEVLSGCESILENAAEYLMRDEVAHVEDDKLADDDSYTIFVFNPLSVPVRSWVEFELNLMPGSQGIEVSSDDAIEPIQVVDLRRYEGGDIKSIRAGMIPLLPPMGFRLFEIKPSKELESGKVEEPVKVSDTTIANEHLWVEVDPSSGLIGEARLSTQRSFFLNGSNRLTLEKDFGNLYQAIAFGTTFLHPRRVERVRVKESGPLRGTLEVIGKVGHSPFTQRVSLVKGSPRIDCETSIYFKDKGTRLRARFETGIGKGKWTHEIPFGWIERENHELPAQNFVDISKQDHGVTLINFGIPGNKFADGTIFLTLMRSLDKIYLWDSGPEALGLGEHDFSYSLYPHEGDMIEAQSLLQAYIRNNPPRVFIARGRCREKSRSGYSALRSLSPESLVSAFERTEDGKIMARVWETAGEGGTREFKLGWEAESAHKADFLERKMEDLGISGDTLKVPLRRFEIANLIFEGPA
ncbi:MAG: glycoside hydrolase family 38 C-terminal domain-containing protein [Actinomycetota bacterium]|nr:glycoside hydrolase family 38 C-terminal domain-containing protein [Actinomycetota bacterium]